MLHVAYDDLDNLLKFTTSQPLRRMAVAAVLGALLRLHSTALVITISSPAWAQSRGVAAKLTHRLLASTSSLFITFDGTDTTVHADRRIVIPHAHFRDRFVGYPRGTQVPGRLLWISGGGTEDASPAQLVRDLSTTAVTIHLIRMEPSPSMRTLLSPEPLPSPGSHPSLRHLSDGAYIIELDTCELAVVPATESIEQIQAVFLALSANRPILTLRTDAMAHLADEVGRGWLHLVDQAVSASDVDRTLATLRATPPDGPPKLDGRDLASRHAAYADAFQSAAALSARTRRGRTPPEL